MKTRRLNEYLVTYVGAAYNTRKNIGATSFKNALVLAEAIAPKYKGKPRSVEDLRNIRSSIIIEDARK